MSTRADLSVTISNPAKIWAAIRRRADELRPGVGAVYQHATLFGLTNERLVVTFERGSFFGRQARAPEAMKAIEDAAEEVLGVRPTVELLGNEPIAASAPIGDFEIGRHELEHARSGALVAKWQRISEDAAELLHDASGLDAFSPLVIEDGRVVLAYEGGADPGTSPDAPMGEMLEAIGMAAAQFTGRGTKVEVVEELWTERQRARVGRAAEPMRPSDPDAEAGASYRTPAKARGTKPLADALESDKAAAGEAARASNLRGGLWGTIAVTALVLVGVGGGIAVMLAQQARALEAAEAMTAFASCAAALFAAFGVWRKRRDHRVEQCQLEIRRLAGRRVDGLFTVDLIHTIESEFGRSVYASALNGLCASGEVRSRDEAFYYVGRT